MTIRLFGIIIHITKQEKAPAVQIDEAKRAEDVKAIVESPAFQELKAKAQQARTMRG